FGTDPLIDPGRRIADHLGDIGQRFGGALEPLADQPARLLAGLGCDLLATAPDTVGKPAFRTAAAGYRPLGITAGRRHLPFDDECRVLHRDGPAVAGL